MHRVTKKRCSNSVRSQQGLNVHSNRLAEGSALTICVWFQPIFPAGGNLGHALLVAPAVGAESDLVPTMGTRRAKAFSGGIVFRPPSIELEGIEVALFWSERTQADPAHRWLRGLKARVAHEL